MAKQSLSDISKSNREKDAARFAAPSAAPALAPLVGVESKIEWWPVERIDDNPFQPRSAIEQGPLDDLIASINKDGMRQIGEARVSPDDATRVQLVFAHRRKYAILGGANAGAGEAEPERYRGLMPLRVYQTLTKSQMLRRAIDENEKRVDVSPLDRARAYLKLRDLVTEEMMAAGEPLGNTLIDLIEDGVEGAELSDALGRNALEPKAASWRAVARASGDEKKWRQMHRTAQLLELPDDAKELLEKMLLNARQGRALVSMLGTPAEAQIGALAAEAVKARLTGEMAEKRAKQLIELASAPQVAPQLADAADAATRQSAEKGAEKARAVNQLALETGTSHLSAVPPVKDLPVKDSSDGDSFEKPVANPAGEDTSKTAMETWANAIIRARIQPAALSLDSARQSFQLAKFGARERKQILASIEQLEAILERAKAAL